MEGDKLIVFGPISVATVLVHNTPDKIRTYVQECMRICQGQASLVLFTTNEILPDVPFENMQALYEALRK